MAESNIGFAGYAEGVGGLLQLFGNLQAGRAARINAERAKVQAQFAALQAERQAGVAIAVSQRRSAEEVRKGKLDASRALAVAAASGGGVSDPTMVKLLSDARGEAVYRANVALYEGEAQARQLRLEAASGELSGSYTLEEGLRTEENYAIAGAGKAIGAGGSLYAKYGVAGFSNARGDRALIPDVPASNRM